MEKNEGSVAIITESYEGLLILYSVGRPRLYTDTHTWKFTNVKNSMYIQAGGQTDGQTRATFISHV